jgi:hypothetical protein
VYEPLEQFDATVAVPCAAAAEIVHVSGAFSGSDTDGTHGIAESSFPLIVRSLATGAAFPPVTDTEIVADDVEVPSLTLNANESEPP